MPYITLNKNNFFNNLNIIANKTKDIDKIALVLKDNAYGHGIIEISQMAQEYGIKKCIVQNSEEAIEVESYFDYVLVLADFPKEVNDKIRYTINDISQISKFPKGTKVELKVDSGMHRNGISPDELYTAFARIKEHELTLEAVLTHHRNADALTSEWFWQNEVFKKVKAHSVKLASEFKVGKLRFHSCNSAALFRVKNIDEDMVRVGIAAYGCMVLPKALEVEGFRPVLSLYAQKISTRRLNISQGVGYGATYIADKACSVSNYDFGYGSGFLRACSNSYVTPKGFELVGRVSMDNSSFICDEEEILIFNNAIDAAKYAKTISYEVLTSLKADIRRRVIN